MYEHLMKPHRQKACFLLREYAVLSIETKTIWEDLGIDISNTGVGHLLHTNALCRLSVNKEIIARQAYSVQGRLQT